MNRLLKLVKLKKGIERENISLPPSSGTPIEFISAKDSDTGTFIVLGCSRGGTSLISGVLRILGIWMGDDLGRQHENNQDFGRAVPLEKKLKKISIYNKKLTKWGWKHPNTVYWIHKVEKKLRNPHYIVIYRNPMDIVLSKVRRGKHDFSEKLFDIPLAHYKEMHSFLKTNTAPRLYVSFENSLANRESFLDKMAEFVGVELTDDIRQQAYDFINPDKGYKKF